MAARRWIRCSTTVACAAISLVVLAGCYTAKGATKADKRAYTRSMSSQVLADLFKEKPEVRARLEKAVGYATFSNLNLKVIAVASGQGYGMAVDNGTKKETFMRMAEIGGGFGLGGSDFRAVMIFHDKQAFKNFIDVGMEVTGKAGAEGKAGDQGMAARQEAKMAGAGAESADVLPKVETYQITKTGVMYQAMIYGTKYWKDPELN